MDKVQKQAALREIEEYRSRLINIVNTKMDELRDMVVSGTASSGDGEFVYPLTTMPELFKGRKPAAVIFGSERVPVTKWRTAYTEILKRCDADEACHDMLMRMRNLVHGRARTILSDSPERMNVPVEIREGLYAEAYFDTGALLRMLTIRILKPAGYDYSGISIAVKDHLSA